MSVLAVTGAEAAGLVGSAIATGVIVGIVVVLLSLVGLGGR